jgi:hypothetical protein
MDIAAHFWGNQYRKKTALKDVFNAKAKVLCLKNELCQAQTQAWHDILIIHALKLSKFNFVGMQSWLDKFLAENEEYQTQLLTLQDRLIVVQVDLDRL